MSLWVPWALWVPSVLLVILLPGCLSLSCPSSVNGTIGGSLSVQCTYQKKEDEKNKFWCKSPCLLWTSIIVETSNTEQEVTKDRVTIRDDPANLTFTVTLERLRAADSGKYTCGVAKFAFDTKVEVVVSVFPAPQATSASPETSTEPALLTCPMLIQKEAPGLYPSADPEPSKGRSLLGSIQFWILVFLKVPVLLCMMGAILWMRGLRSTPRPSKTPVCQPVVLLPGELNSKVQPSVPRIHDQHETGSCSPP